MARPLRVDPDGGWHHVMNRGVDRMDIFRDDGDRRWFLHLLVEAVEAVEAELVAYCLVGNHFHLLLHCPVGGLSRMMWRAGANYARVFNKRHGRDGPVFRGRFLSKLVDSDDYLTYLLRYIHCNPLDLGVRPGDWRWSSYRAYAGLAECPPWLHTTTSLRIAGGQSAHREHVSQAFAKANRLASASDPEIIHEAWYADTSRPSMSAIADAVDLCGTRLSVTQRRAVTLLVALDVTTWRTTDLAEQLGVTSASVVRTRAHRARALVAKDDQLARIVERVSDRLGPAA